MMRRWMFAVLCGVVAPVAAGAVYAEPWTWNGIVRAGGIFVDQVGDESTMPETYNIHNGFVLSSFQLKGQQNSRQHLRLDLTDVNHDNRQGVFDLRRTGMWYLRSSLVKSRWVFDPAGSVDASRSSWDNVLSWTPRRSLRFAASYNLQTRSGDRIDLNPGDEGWLGTEYDSKLHRYRIEGQVRGDNGVGGTLAYDGVTQRDAIDSRRGRDGYVLAAIFHAPDVYLTNFTHVVRGAIGRNEVRGSSLGFDMKSVQYTGVWRALDLLRLRYRFYGSRVDDEASAIKTDNFMQDIDGTFSYRFAVLTLGYGWEALDDDRAQTTTNKFRGALSLRGLNNRVSGKIVYNNRDKNDAEHTTLLRDFESDRLDMRVDLQPLSALALGARFSDREREYPDLQLQTFGFAGSVYGTWTGSITVAQVPAAITELGVEYAYADDEYDNYLGDQHVESKVLTGRVGLTLWKDLDLTGSYTYLELDKDLTLNVKKSIMSIGAAYRFQSGFRTDIKYNVYNYDDYLIIDRYYTANVVWLTVGHDFSID